MDTCVHMLVFYFRVCLPSDVGQASSSNKRDQGVTATKLAVKKSCKNWNRLCFEQSKDGSSGTWPSPDATMAFRCTMDMQATSKLSLTLCAQSRMWGLVLGQKEWGQHIRTPNQWVSMRVCIRSSLVPTRCTVAHDLLRPFKTHVSALLVNPELLPGTSDNTNANLDTTRKRAVVGVTDSVNCMNWKVYRLGLPPSVFPLICSFFLASKRFQKGLYMGVVISQFQNVELHNLIICTN